MDKHRPYALSFTSKQKDIEANSNSGERKKVIDKESEDNQKLVLDFIQDYIEEEISYAEVISYTDTHHEDIGEIVRFLLFSRGDKEFYISYDMNGYIFSYGKNIPRLLLLDIHNAICYAIQLLHEAEIDE